MPITGTHAHTRELESGVLVANELFRTGQSPIGCPAGVLIVGELRRRGLEPIRGPLRLDGDGTSSSVHGLGQMRVTERETAHESTHFTLPAAVPP
jgi:hypothetical protein